MKIIRKTTFKLVYTSITKQYLIDYNIKTNDLYNFIESIALDDFGISNIEIIIGTTELRENGLIIPNDDNTLYNHLIDFNIKKKDILQNSISFYIRHKYHNALIYECPICIDSFDINNIVYPFQCRHNLCITCFNGINIIDNVICPLCRSI